MFELETDDDRGWEPEPPPRNTYPTYWHVLASSLAQAAGSCRQVFSHR